MGWVRDAPHDSTDHLSTSSRYHYNSFIYIILYHPVSFHGSPIFAPGTTGRNGPRFSIKPLNKAIYYSLYISIYSVQPILTLLYNSCSSCSTCSTKEEKASNINGFMDFRGWNKTAKKWNRWNNFSLVKWFPGAARSPGGNKENKKVEQD